MPRDPDYVYNLEGAPVVGQVVLLPRWAEQEIIQLQRTHTFDKLTYCPQKAFGHRLICLSEPEKDGQIDVVVATSFDDRPVTDARKAHEQDKYMEIFNIHTARGRDLSRVLRFSDPEGEMKKHSYITLASYYIPWKVCKQWHVMTEGGCLVEDTDSMALLRTELTKAMAREKDAQFGTEPQQQERGLVRPQINKDGFQVWDGKNQKERKKRARRNNASVTTAEPQTTTTAEPQTTNTTESETKNTTESETRNTTESEITTTSESQTPAANRMTDSKVLTSPNMFEVLGALMNGEKDGGGGKHGDEGNGDEDD